MIKTSLLYMILLGFVVSSCTTSRQAATNYREKLISEGRPTTYADGYYDGYISCSYNKIQKDILLAVESKLYEMGWGDGYKTCEQEQKATQSALNSVRSTGQELQKAGSYRY